MRMAELPLSVRIHQCYGLSYAWRSIACYYLYMLTL